MSSTIPKVSKRTQMTGHRAAIFSLAAGKGPGHVLSGAGDGWVVTWDLDRPDTGKLLARVETQIFSMLLIPEQNIVLAGNMNGGLHWVHPDEPGKTKNILHHKPGVYAIHRAGDFIFSAGGGGVLSKWSVEEQRPLESIQLARQSLRCIAWHRGRNELAIGSSDNSIFFLDATTMALRHTLREAHGNSVFCLQYHPTRPVLLSGGRDAHLKARDLDNNYELLSDQPAHWFTINDLAFDPTGQWLATASRDKTIKIWDANSYALLKVLDSARDKGHLNSVNKLFWDPKGNQLLSASDDRSIILWDVI